MIRAWNACTWPAGLGSIQIIIQPYLYYNNFKVLFEVIGSREDGYAPQLLGTFHARSHRLVMPGEPGEGAVAQEALEHSDVVDEAVRNITFEMFSKLCMLVKNTQVCC